MTTSVRQIADEIRSASTTASAVTLQAANGVAASNKHLNAWLTMNGEAESDAQRIDHERSLVNKGGVLSGVPCGIKDLIDAAGMPTTAGSNFPHQIATEDAGVVKLLRAAGAVILGKTATHEFAFGPTGDIAATGPTFNPHDLTKMSGGSSSGSGAAVAAGHVPFALGTDTGGSVRIPAALCGTVGLRPTSGTVDATGVIPLAPTLDTVGILASDVDGVSRVWGVISETASDAVMAVPGAVKVGLITDGFYSKVSTEVADSMTNAVRALRNAGVIVSDVTLGWLEESISVYDHIQSAEAVATHRQRLLEHPELFQDEVRTRLQGAQRVQEREYRSALTRRSQWQARVDEYFGDCDVLICPTAPITAPLIGQRSGFDAGWTNAKEALLNFTSPWSVLGVPALALPMGKGSDGMPTSVQLIGRPKCEQTVFSVALLLEELVRAKNSPLAHSHAESARVITAIC
ncbi:amidase [Arthrobacter sp. KBS0703]|uniref:amidase n=1 Tax=Arthrobacter sp. KBS0703 TaxID=1955698 RepID=UPI00098FF90B|nr:amidase [Arthrobacter sp. KBS0703]TSE14491.1 amidase [Arthrobacter sp. KBS0703]